MKKILIVFGTRPEAIKMAPIIEKLKSSNVYKWEVCITAQHRQMLDQVIELFNTPIHYDLDLMKPNQTLSKLSANILESLDNVFQKSQPDIVLVHGDTTTSFITALSAFYHNIKIGHIEAGLRTYNLKAPFPEEANRELTARLANFHFAPTENAKANLLSEHIPYENIIVTGNTVIDALFLTLNKINNSAPLKEHIEKELLLSGYLPSDREYILITAHRRENFGKGFDEIFKAIREIAYKKPEIDIVYPVHLNPNVYNKAHKILEGVSNIFLIKPLEYAPFVYLMNRAKLILTDSGGIQEEAPSLGKPVLVLRETTERPEAIEAGTVKLVGTDSKQIFRESINLLEDDNLYQNMANAINPYGDGRASERIIDFLYSLPSN